ncbi:mannitol-1-phosphate 5-dehydrogenase [Paenibacillus chitinolyticus]|uniref:mannitol-1-phosphate 5-dehydrogenase n=1 Tax=Paenibacillus chitinolyticus TaxID=79263 RepID=UPI002DBF44CC|nr:mannitol-1-phosphate 5-dehydrogenase [Paenibacillus chitinolyticus]MEC0245941.1 mannitol-1-phosphate 5-dehydrogenase [Paenibacillus chitinolyticus]
MKKAVHFGAGNIGRGFIGLLLSQSGFEVSFVDVNSDLVNLLNEKKQYTVTLANEQQDATVVKQVSAVNGTDLSKVAEAVAEADLVTTAVGVSVLKHIAAGIAQGISKRLQTDAPSPLHIIACENAIGGSTRLKEHVYSHLSAGMRELADRFIAFPDAAVDRIVPIQRHEDPLAVTVEPFYEWVVDRSAMLNGFPEIAGIHAVDNLEPYIERKLFTVNTGHCSAAYHGYLRGYETIQKAMAAEDVLDEVRSVLHETGAMLVRKYGFDDAEHRRYIDKILERFVNPYLTDEVVRVGRSPIRKLSPDDRLVRPARLAYELGLETGRLTKAMAAALRFDYADDPEAVELQTSIRENGVSRAATDITGLPEDHPLHKGIMDHYDSLRKS